MVYRWIDAAGGLLLPPRCVLCGRAGSSPCLDLCAACEAELPRLDRPCLRCGLPRSPDAVDAATPEEGCPQCPAEPVAYAICFAPFVYEFPLADLIQSLKYDGALANARVLGWLLASRVAERGLAEPADVIVPMPLHASRLMDRGFNQSFEIARVVSRALELPCDLRALQRTRRTSPQVDLARVERRANVRGAFTADPARVAGKTIVLLDDVITTGSTVAEAAHALIAAGATAVHAWSVARALA